MLLKSLEIHGFKSFPDKTVLSFGQGMTAVVGPNGSGKSNISDAIRWVLGEQSTKSLRGSKMEDVIFNGTAQRKPVGFAEVSLVIDNRSRKLDFDADDVKVTRRYYRSGESEYLINNATVRLKDVQMLFMDTGLGRDGYSIIGQGRIGDIVASKSEERREIFEEAAGISKYRYRKNEAERRLKSTEENLLRLRDILQELEERVGPLAQQAEKAKKFLEYAGEKKDLEIGLWLHTMIDSRAVLRELSAKLELARTQYEAAGEAMDGFEAQMEDIARQAPELFRQLQQEAAAAEADLTGTRGELATAQEDRIRLEGEVRRLAEQEEASRRAAEEAAAEITTLNERAEECKRTAAGAAAEAAEATERKTALEAELQAASGGRQELTAKREELSAKIAEIKLEVVAYNKEIEALEGAIRDLHARRQDAAGHKVALQAQITTLAEANEALQERIAEKNRQAEALREQAAASGAQIEALAARRTEGEAMQTKLRQQSREKAEERELAGREAARLEEKCGAVQKDVDDVVRRLYEEYELTRTEAEAAAKPIADPAAANRRLGELKSKIRGLGSVNVDAIEEYKEVSERYEFLNAQVQDVEVSKDELLALIGELTVQMREIFIERFKQINYNYGIVFAEMFGGGKGELKLSDPDDILHSGIEMHVQPPGKVILNLDVLSGGEKALAAIALLFAILKVTPSPFCVLDEIEAALDDVNVDRYAAYLRRMCDNTQFIAITHRRGTMEEADVLYGVTMQEQGVSKLLELRASEVEQKLGISMNQA